MLPSPFMAGLLKKLGFDKVFDFSFAADLTIVEETTEFTKPHRGKRGHAPIYLLLPRLGQLC